MELAKLILPVVLGFAGLTGTVTIENYLLYPKRVYGAQKEIEVKRAIRIERYNGYPSGDLYSELKAELEFDAKNNGRIEKVVKEYELAHPNAKFWAHVGAGIFGFLAGCGVGLAISEISDYTGGGSLPSDWYGLADGHTWGGEN